MQTINLKTAMLKTALAAIVLLSASGAAQAQQQVNLTAAPAATTLSDGSVVPMWGYSCGAAVSGSRASCTALNSTAGASWSPVVIMVPSGQGLTINLTNNLAFSNGNKVPTSLVIAGQVGGGLGSGGTTTSSPDHSTVRTGTWPIAGATPPVSALAPQQGPRVQSFATEVVAAGVTPVLPQVASGSSLTWGSLQPGTYLIQSGTHPSIQVPMGLYGILVVTDAANGIAYPAATSGKAAAVTYNGDVPLLFSEIDPVQNTAVSNAVNAVAFSGTLVWSGQPGGCGNPAYVPSAATPACYPPAVNYTPLYFLINGRTFDTTNASVSVFPVNPLPSNTCTPVSPATTCVPTVSGNVLVRLVNAGLRMHVPSIVGATTGTTNAPGMTLVAEDGNVLPGLARIQNEVFLAAGKTHDVMINAPAASLTALPIYDRELSLSANATARDAGMLAYIGVNGAGLPAPTASGALGAAVANPDTYNALVPGMPLTISDPGKGVIANDVRVHGVQLLTPPTSGSVTLYANGTFSYFASKISVALTNGGSGYATTPVVTFTAPPSGGTLATATAAVGTSGVSSIAMGSNGAGYTAPTVTIGAPPAGGTQATATATIKSSVTVTLGTAGSGYGTPVVTIDPPPPGGTPATATATVDGTGAITTLTVTNAGAGYVAAPGVTISDSTPGSTATGATATAGIASGTGVISAINLTNPGSGYTVPPAVTIADTVPPTSGASATAILSPGAGTVTAINLTYPGSGYTLPPAVTITGGAGTGATATASIVAGSATSDSFTYCANGTVNAGVCSSGITAPVTLGASTLLATAGVTCTGTTFNSNVATYLAVGTPGVLAGCTDAAGLQVTVDTSTISATGITVLADANGGFTATSTAAGAYSFSFKAKNSLGMQSAATTVTVVFPTPSNLTVTVLDGADHVTKLDDYRWIIEEDRTFYVDPACTSNPLPAGCPTISSTVTNPINYGTNFHTSAMPLVAAGCTGPLSCESGQTMQTAVAVVCDVGNGVCRPGTQQTATLPGSVHLDTSKRYYISILPGDAANPFIGGNLSAPTNCTSPYNADGTLNTGCGHGMGGAPIAAACGPQSASKAVCSATSSFPNVTILTVPTPLPTGTLSVFVYQDDYPLNGEHGSGGGVDVLAPQEPGLGGFQVTIFDQAGGTGDVTGQPTYDMFNQPLTNSLAGTIDPVTGLDACPISPVASANSAYNTANAAAIANGTPGVAAKSTATGMIVTCPKFEGDGKTLSPMAGQALVNNLYPGRYGIAALPGASRIALGEEWVQTNTLDGQKAHDSFVRVGEPGFFQEFGPAGYHVSIGFANPKLINERRYNSSQSGMCDTGAKGGNLACTFEVKGTVTGSRLSRAPDSRLYSSGSRASLAFTQCYVSLGDPDGAEIAFSKCDADGNFDFKGIPAGNWKVTTFDQWNDQIIDGITQPVAVGCANNFGGLCTSVTGGPNKETCKGPGTIGTVCDMGEIGVHQWQANIYTRTFIDNEGTGVSDDTGNGSTKPGLALAATNIRFRDGSYSNFNNTDLNGYAGFNEIFPLFNWYVIETDSTRYKSTGTHVIYDAGGPADGSASCGTGASNSNPLCGGSSIAQGLANTYEKYPLPPLLSVPGAVYCDNADCVGKSIKNGATPSTTDPTKTSTGRIDPPLWFGSYGWQGYIGQGNFLEFGKKPFAEGETGPIHGHVVYSSTRPFDDPRLLLQLSWEPLIAHVTVNLYQEGVAADGVTPTLKLVDTTQTTSWDDWVQGFRADGQPNMNCPGQSPGVDSSNNVLDPFFYGLSNQPHYLDWYNSQHGGPGPTALPYNSQYKCYDGMHTWNQLQPAPYDGMYSFPSVTGFDPAGKPSGTNCKACVPNPDTSDRYRYGQPMLPAGKYVVEVVVPPGYELVKEEDKNILIGDNYIAPAAVQFPGLGSGVYILPDQATLAATYNPLNPQNATTNLGRNGALPSHEGDTGSDESFWPCVGEVRQVPDFISLFPGSNEVAPFAGAYRPLCDRKEVALNEQTSVLTKFYLFTSTHVASHFQGIILDDFAAEFDPFSPAFGEKFAPSYLPVGVKDWTGNEINRVYTDQFGLYNGLNYSTWEVNPPNPTGYGPTMMVMCMNDSGLLSAPDPLHQPGYSQFCYELPFMPGQTGYFDTPVVPVSAFASGSYNRPDCNYPDATPAIASVTGDVAGPWVSAPAKTITINALGNQSVDWYGFTGPSVTQAPYNQQKITRHYGFGGQGTVTIGGINAPVTSWSDTTITVTAPPGVPACATQQQAVYGGSPASCGQLVVTTAAGKQSIDTVTVTIGGKTPTVLASGATIQSAIDAAAPGDMIIVPAGTYNEMLVMWKPVRLQGVGAASSIVDANAHPAGKLIQPWREKVVCLFGLTGGRPDTSTGRACLNGLNGATNSEPSGTGYVNFPNLVVDRLPLEATLGWDAGLNGNLAEQLIEPSLLGAYEGAVITVVGKGVKFPTGTQILDAFGQTTATPAAFPNNSVFLTSSDCGTGSTALTAYPSNFYCNPSSIDGLGLRNSSQGGGGIFVHAYAHNLQIANNRVGNNQGTMSGGMTIGAGEHGDIALGGTGQTVAQYPASCESSSVQNLSLPFCFNTHVNIHHNAVVANSSLGDEIFSSTPAGAGGVSVNTGSDYYQFKNNWVCGNLSSGDGGGFSHIGFSKNADIEHNTILFNQSTNPTITTNGGGLLVMGAPDADPTTCGVSTDQDCLATPGSIPPSDGTGQGMIINANLILGNAADSGSGGGLRVQHVNGTDVLNNPNGQTACSADLSSCIWSSVNVTNNIIVNNVAGWDGAGISLLDVLAANIVNNTIASNDATASSGTLFQSLFAPLASSVAPSGNVTCGATNGQSCPQVAGLVSVSHSPVLQANLGLLPANTPLTCPRGHGVASTVAGGQPSCYYNSIPLLFNDAIWQNRSFYIGVGGLGTTSNQNQQHLVTLYPASQLTAATPTPAGSQTATGGCPTDSSYWDLGFRGDTAATSHIASGFAPNNSLLTATTYGGNNNSAANPAFASQYCNGSRSPPELGQGGYAVPPGVNEFNAFPNPVFSLKPSGVVDEGNNWVNVRWGPLALTSPATNAVLGNYAPAIGSPAIDSGVASVNVAGTTVAAPASDFFGNPRPAGAGFDIGAVEFPELALSPSSFNFGNVPVLTTSAAQVFTLSNPPAGQTVTGIGVTLVGTNAADYAISANNCGATLAPGAQCTISVTFTPNLLGPRTATLRVVDSEGTQTASLTGTGTGPLYSVTPASLSFPNTVVGTVSAPQQLTVRNNQTTSMTVTADALGGLFGTQYAIATGTTCLVNAIVASGGTCVINVTFNPQTFFGLGGIRPATLSLTAAGLTTIVPLSGTAILFPVDVTPKGFFGINGALLFPNTQVGQASPVLIATLSNYQSSTAVTVNSISTVSQFQIVSGPLTTCTAGTVLPPASTNGTPTTCTLAVDFAPNAQNLFFGFNFPWMQTVTFNLTGSPVNPTLTLIGTALRSAISGTTAFASQLVNTTSASHVFTYTNSGGAAITLTGVTSGGTNAANYTIVSNTCSGAGTTPVAAGGTCQVGVTLTPSATGNRTASLSFTDVIGSQSVTLNGTGINPTFSGATSFGNVLVGSSVAQTITLTNSASAGSATITAAPTLTVGTGFTIVAGTGTTCVNGAVLAAGGGNCTLRIQFAPASAGSKSATLSVTDTAGTQTVGLSGAGLLQATTTPGSITFANTARGSVSATTLVTLANPAGNPSMTRTSIAFGGTNATYFGRSTTTPGSCGTGTTFTVGAGSSCTIGVVFAPPATGTTGLESGTMTISTTSAVPPPTPVTLSGTAL